MCPGHYEKSDNGYGDAGSILKEGENTKYLYPIGFLQRPWQSTIGRSETSASMLVYERRNSHTKSSFVNSIQRCVSATRSKDASLSVISDAPSIAKKDEHVPRFDHNLEIVEAPAVPLSISNKEPHSLKLESTFGSMVEDPDLTGLPNSARMKNNDVDSAIDSCSSSKSNVELVSAWTRAEVDDTGECSSSSVILKEATGKDLSDKDVCLSILWNEGVIKRVQRGKENASSEDFGTRSDTSSWQSCKICSHTESTLKMLICDNCEEAFHLSCCQRPIKSVPIDEWFCHSCWKRAPRSLNETSSRKSATIFGGMDKNRCGSLSSELSPIELMLRDKKPYTTVVRVGESFQANVPYWSGPVTNESDTIGEPSELDPLEFVSLHDFNKPRKLDSMSNWLQCKGILDVPGGSGAICGKWRRAPLFEKQTDDWECFCCCVWDSAHADCAVLQELETEEILKQLKYVQKLRTRLAAKRQKKDHTKSINSLGRERDVTHVYVRKGTRTK